jgi:hypothetical protein
MGYTAVDIKNAVLVGAFGGALMGTFGIELEIV